MLLKGVAKRLLSQGQVPRRSGRSSGFLDPLSVSTLYQACRSFAAWRPEWQRKKPSRQKELKQNSRFKKQMEALRCRREKLNEIGRKRMKYVTFHPGRPDNVLDGNENLLADLQFFHATHSPFVYLAHSPEDIYIQDQYWNFAPTYKQSRSKFFYFPRSVFLEQKSQCPFPEDSKLGEVSFLGRSNVGKSSLMNALMLDNLCRTSKLPGRTQQVMMYAMFDIADVAYRSDWRRSLGFLVDLPGYGYARGPDEAVDAWQKNTQRYLLRRMESGNLRRLYILVDSRQVQQTMDWSIFRWLDDSASGIPYTIVLTKADSIKGGPASIRPHLNSLCMRFQHKFVKSNRYTEDAEAELPEQDEVVSEKEEEEEEEDTGNGLKGGQSPVIHITSATKGMGLEELWKSVTWELALRPQLEN